MLLAMTSAPITSNEISMDGSAHFNASGENDAQESSIGETLSADGSDLFSYPNKSCYNHEIAEIHSSTSLATEHVVNGFDLEPSPDAAGSEMEIEEEVSSEMKKHQNSLIVSNRGSIIDENLKENIDGPTSTAPPKFTMENRSELLLTEITSSTKPLLELNSLLQRSAPINKHLPKDLELASSSINNDCAIKPVKHSEDCDDQQIILLAAKLNQLELENQQIIAESTLHKEAIETLHETISQQQSELQHLNESNQQQAEIDALNYSLMKNDLEGQLERMTKMYESANKDRDATVMRYAVSEKEVIGLKRDRELFDKRLKETLREKDLLIAKLKGITSEKDRVCQMLDLKCHELSKVQKEYEKVKEDLNSREIKIKWAQNKLCTEMEMHKETQTKLDKLVKKLQDTREESEQVRRDCQNMMRTFQTSEENKAFTLEQQLKEQQASLIMERHERHDKEESLRQLQQEVDTLKSRHQVIISENNLLSIKVQNLEKERLEYEQNLSKLKRTTDDQRQNVVDLHSQLAEMESIRIQLQHEQERLSASQSEVERLRLSNVELQQDMAACREREAELLDFTQKLTDKNVRLQSEFSATEAKAEQLESELGPQMKQVSELQARVSLLSEQLDKEKRLRLEESQLLARHLAEKTQCADTLAQQLEDQEGENQVLKRKQAATLKELMRELLQARKRLEAHEALSGNNSLGHSSRASSSTSLNTLDSSQNPSSAVKQGGVSTEISPNGTEPSNIPLEPDRQLLIERIVKLQRANARKTEKLEFMEEHARQLVAELQKKTRVVQSYILREQSGALSSNSMDQNKAEVTKHGGIMASLYGSKSMDDTMTLDLSLEINRKLQAVLEDTLLKNITLKENIDTLGAEISRLQHTEKS